ncbi:MAG: class I SAM-dependent methyltransferase [Lachnospiraceae bacterium]|nr:class I SAM-dependent methyltransferase [Lachnospiraceae bacterium]
MISKRLEMIVGLVPACGCAADIGTDHGYVPISLAKRGDVKKIIGMDIRKMPLEKARENIKSEGLEDKIELRLSDGAAALKEGEADVIVISGMGGSLIAKIMQEREDVFKKASLLVLSPQSEIAQFRRTILLNGYDIKEESVLEEDGKYYFLMTVSFDDVLHDDYSDEELTYGRAGLIKKDPVLREFIKRDIRLSEDVLKKLEGKTGLSADEKRSEQKKKICIAERAIERYK